MNRKIVAFVFNTQDRGLLKINNTLYQAPDVMTLEKAMKSAAFDLFEEGESAIWFEDVRNFIWCSEETKSTPYVYASRAHQADVIIAVDRTHDEDGNHKDFTFTRIDRRRTERQTLDALLRDGVLKCSELLIAVGQFEGGTINSKYAKRLLRSA